MCVDDCVDVDRDVYCWDWEHYGPSQPLGGPWCPVRSDTGHSERAIAHTCSHLCFAEEFFEDFSFELCEDFQCSNFSVYSVASQVSLQYSSFACIELPPLTPFQVEGQLF